MIGFPKKQERQPQNHTNSSHLLSAMVPPPPSPLPSHPLLPPPGNSAYSQCAVLKTMSPSESIFLSQYPFPNLKIVFYVGHSIRRGVRKLMYPHPPVPTHPPACPHCCLKRFVGLKIKSILTIVIFVFFFFFFFLSLLWNKRL